MIHIDGAEKSGSGTILRYAVALSSLLGEELRIDNIRAKRDKPGLRPQHLASVMASAELSGAQVEGAMVNSRRITYKPQTRIKGGHYEWEIGTAGSTTLLLTTLLPVALFADGNTVFRIQGGLFQDFAPSAHHMQRVLFPLLRRMGVEAEMEIVRPGYVPRGGGIIEVIVKPVASGIKPLKLPNQGKVREVSGLSLSSHLKEARVSQRMAVACQNMLAREGYQARIETLWDDTALQAGASLAVWAETDAGCRLGSDRAGRPGRSSEEIGKYVAQNLVTDLKTGATVDRYLADQLIIYAALAGGTTEYIIPRSTEHVDTNLWLVGKLGVRTRLEGNALQIEGIGYSGRSK